VLDEGEWICFDPAHVGGEMTWEEGKLATAAETSLVSLSGIDEEAPTRSTRSQQRATRTPFAAAPLQPRPSSLSLVLFEP